MFLKIHSKIIKKILLKIFQWFSKFFLKIKNFLLPPFAPSPVESLATALIHTISKII